MAKDSHLTTEQLSAYLDTALAPQERVAVEQHLQACTQCQQVLIGLRQTVAMLHALPQPTLPRSFVLSEAMLEEKTPRTQQEHTSRVLPFPATRQHTKPGNVYNTVRFISALAALVGIFLLGTSIFSTLPHTVPMAGSANSSAGSASGTAMHSADATATKENTKGSLGDGGVGTPSVTHTITPNVTKPAAIGPKPAQPAVQPLQPFLPFLDLTSPQGQASIGILLLALGIISLLALRWQRQRMQM